MVPHVKNDKANLSNRSTVRHGCLPVGRNVSRTGYWVNLSEAIQEGCLTKITPNLEHVSNSVVSS
jgi:hypothetical protein